MRRPAVHELIRNCLADMRGREKFRVCHYSLQKHGMMFLIEAADRQALSRGMQSLCVRIARALNAAFARGGSIFDDRYDTTTLDSASKVRRGLCTVLCAAKRDPTTARTLAGKLDPYSSAVYFDGWRGRAPDPHEDERVPVSRPATQLLSRTWRRMGLIDVDETGQA